MADNDDLDALLNEAMDIVDEQERVHEEEVKQQEAKLDADLQKALDEQNGGGDAMGANMLKMFQSLLGAEGSSAPGDDAGFESFMEDASKLVSTLENVDSLTDSDKANLTRVKELLGVLENDDEDKAKELLEKMKSDPTAAMPDGDASPENVDAAFKNCMGALQQLSESFVASGDSAGPTVSPTETAAAAAASPEGVPDNIAEMLLTAILDPDFAEPIKVMRDAYEPYLAAKNDSLTEAEKTTCRKQHAKTIEICEFLQVPVEKEDDVRVTRLLELMHEFSELGEPPKDLPEYAPKKNVDGTETAAATAE